MAQNGARAADEPLAWNGAPLTGEPLAAGDAWAAGAPAAHPGSALDEVTEAVQRVVARHPALAVTMWVADGSKLSALHVGWTEGTVTVRPAAEPALPIAGAPPRSWPMSVRTAVAWSNPPEESTADAAARLAEMIRRDPSLLARPDDNR